MSRGCDCRDADFRIPHGEAGHSIMTKEKLLGIGDKYETMIAADKAADAVYR